MAETRSQHLVSTQWLHDHLDAPDVVVVDASWHLPPAGRDGKAEYLEEHVPGALFFDIDDLSDADSALPHMLPSPEKFASRMRRMGIGDGNRVVAYDTVGLFSAARAWWMFQVMGHKDAAILDGGLPKWKAEGRPLEDGPPPQQQERHFTARLQTMMVKDKSDVLNVAEAGGAQILDARGAGRFDGSTPEPRKGLRSGHIPGSRNLPYTDLLNQDGTLMDTEDLRTAYERAGIDPAQPVITSCGSGVTAAVLSLGLTVLEARNHALYDGSWSEWGADVDLPIETGGAR
jgi:thiosulfate/3-mercaptopyruvate sulfurtransferase